jgi:hypothetical protein
MVKSMTAAWAAPHFGFADEVVLDPLLRTRDALRGVLAPHGLRLTFLPLLIKAASLALARAPALNGRLDAAGEAFTHLAAHNIGVAMDTPRGLIVPNIKGVQELSVLEIALELKRLQGLAQAGALKEADLAGGSFTCVAHAAPRPLLPRSARADALTSLSLSLSLSPFHARARAPRSLQAVQHWHHWRDVPGASDPAGHCGHWRAGQGVCAAALWEHGAGRQGRGNRGGQRAYSVLGRRSQGH